MTTHNGCKAATSCLQSTNDWNETPGPTFPLFVPPIQAGLRVERCVWFPAWTFRSGVTLKIMDTANAFTTAPLWEQQMIHLLLRVIPNHPICDIYQWDSPNQCSVKFSTHHSMLILGSCWWQESSFDQDLFHGNKADGCYLNGWSHRHLLWFITAVSEFVLLFFFSLSWERFMDGLVCPDPPPSQSSGLPLHRSSAALSNIITA